MKQRMVEVFTEGMTVKEALYVAAKHGNMDLVDTFMKAFMYFCANDGKGMSHEDASAAWLNLPIGVGADGKIAIPVGLGEDDDGKEAE